MGERLLIEVSAETYTLLREHAARRGLTVPELAAKYVYAAAHTVEKLDEFHREHPDFEIPL